MEEIIGVGIGIILFAGAIFYSLFRWDRKRSLNKYPLTFDEFIHKNPEAKVDTGIKCVKCNTDKQSKEKEFDLVLYRCKGCGERLFHSVV